MCLLKRIIAQLTTYSLDVASTEAGETEATHKRRCVGSERCMDRAAVVSGHHVYQRDCLLCWDGVILLPRRWLSAMDVF